MKHAFAAAWLLCASVASAVEIPTGGTPVRLNVTSTSILAWHDNNGNATGCDDHYGEGLERLNLTGTWEGFVVGLRLDGSLYASRPEPTAPGVVEGRCRKVELTSRYLNKLVPEKVWAGWSGKRFEVTVGDSYVSFGRGLTLSLRKTDELGLDNTSRGVRAKFTSDVFEATAVGGFSNITNIDEASGRFEPDPNDGIVGASADVRLFDRLRVGAHAAGFFFQKPVSTISAPGVDESFQEQWVTGGPKLDAPRLLPWLGIYAEALAQRRTAVNGAQETGYGAYGTATAYLGPVTVLFEGKAYGDLHVVQPRFSDITFRPVQYTALPTAERVLQPLTNPQRDIYGGRLRADWAISRELAVFANHGFFRDFVGYLDPETYDLVAGSINDPYIGVDWRWSTWRAVGDVGLRWVQVNGRIVERDRHLDVNLARDLPWSSSLELHLLHLERSHVQPGSESTWREGTVTLSFRKRPKFALGAVVDYTTEAGQPRVWYPAGTAEYNFTESSLARVFVGSSRGGLRCVSGVCRVFPPFSGVKGTLTLRY